ncbi:polynucleotide adenylyltransferase [Sorochytrium milnesiophthora]
MSAAMSLPTSVPPMSQVALQSALPAAHHHDPTLSRRLGVTQPISLAPATPREQELTQQLVQTLRDRNSYESELEAKKRGTVLGRLYEMTRQFVIESCVKKGLPHAQAALLGGKIFTFGSYRLGVHGSGADIDTLCVAPRYVTRDDFFTVMLDMLKARPEVTELAAVPDAFVPVIKMEFDGIPIDLIFAKLGLPQIPEGLELDTNLLRGLDEKEIRSLNGSRVTDEILRLVPDVNEFRVTLRTIKMWAKNRGIYANVLGFFGGVAWAMLVARVCQLYPTATASTLVGKFFHVMKAWPWPNPILLKPLEDGPLNVRQWNPRLYPSDQAHLMPIITPAYPSMCATHNVTHSTKAIICREFASAVSVTDRILVGVAPWADLFEKFRFFHSYEWYLQIVASSDSSEMQLKFSGMVESKLRQLVMRLENTPGLALLQPYTRTYDRNYVYATDEERLKIAAGAWPVPSPDDIKSRALNAEEIASALAPPAPSATNADDGKDDKAKEAPKESAAAPPALRAIYTTSFYIGMQLIKAKDGGPKKRYEIFYPIEEFKNIVQSWESYDTLRMHVTIQNLKNVQLPDDLFEPGETKPAPKSKKRSQDGGHNANLPKKSKPTTVEPAA